jgi:hypothetical protein
MFSDPDSVQLAKEKLSVKTLGESRLVDDYEVYEIDFGAPADDMLLVPASESSITTTTILTTTTSYASDSSTRIHKDLGSDFPQNLQLMHNSQQFSSSRSGSSMLVKPKHNPCDRK